MDIFLDQTKEDIVLVGGDLKITPSRQDELIQRLFVRFKTFEREWFWNTSYGVDYLNEVFGIKKNVNTIDILMRNTINKELLVESILSFTSKVKDYKYSCSFTVKLVNEETTKTIYFLVNENNIYLTDGKNRLFTSF